MFQRYIVLGFCTLSFCALHNYQLRAQDVQTDRTHSEQPTPLPNITMKEREELGRFGRQLPADFRMPSEDITKKLLREYGAVFVSRGAVPPKTVVFKDHNDVAAFQKSVESQTEMIGGMPMTLQKNAMKDLLVSIGEAETQGLSITPRDTDSASRSYDESVSLWASRVEPALSHWVGKKKITEADATRIRSLSPYDQVGEVLQLEKRKIWFAKDLNKSIIYSVAPPGTSQHLSMLAFDVKEYDDPKIRSILAKHGWFQTVVSDLPHFTYLGVSESELKGLGLKKKKNGGRVFWVPDI